MHETIGKRGGAQALLRTHGAAAVYTRVGTTGGEFAINVTASPDADNIRDHGAHTASRRGRALHVLVAKSAVPAPINTGRDTMTVPAEWADPAAAPGELVTLTVEDVDATSAGAALWKLALAHDGGRRAAPNNTATSAGGGGG